MMEQKKQYDHPLIEEEIIETDDVICLSVFDSRLYSDEPNGDEEVFGTK